MPLCKEDIERKTKILKPGDETGSSSKVLSPWLGGNFALILILLTMVSFESQAKPPFCFLCNR